MTGAKPRLIVKTKERLVFNPSAIPELLLIGLPLFVLCPRILPRGSGQLYQQYLIMALHFHTFVFRWLMFRDGWVFLFATCPVGNSATG